MGGPFYDSICISNEREKAQPNVAALFPSVYPTFLRAQTLFLAYGVISQIDKDESL